MVLKLGINEWPMPGRDRSTRHVREGISRADAQRRRSVRALRRLEGYLLLRLHSSFDRRLRRLSRSIRSQRPAGSDNYSDRAASRFLLPVALCGAVLPAAISRDSDTSDWTGDRNRCAVAASIFAGEGEKSWKRRPIAVLTILLAAVMLSSLTHLGLHTPWSPIMDAWSSVPIPSEYLQGRTALERRGALVFQAKQCRNCHSLDDMGGKRGPALDRVALRLTQDQLIRQVIQGGGNMPAYGKNLSPAETTALVAFLETLHPAGQPPAGNAARDVVLGASAEGSSSYASIESSMSPEVQTVLQSWVFPVPVTCALVVTVFVYLRGWCRLRSLLPNVASSSRLACFMTGVFALWIAVGSPLAAFDDDLLSIHMVQHILLMAVAPPLILLGAPALPLLHGLPQSFVRFVLGPLLRWPALQWLGHTLTHPVFCWVAATVTLIAWHSPSAFEFALRSKFWHEIEHACFFATSILFWWPVVQPWPSVARWPRWSIPLYLFTGMMANDALSAFLAFCDRVLYPSYASASRLFPITPLDDQALAGALMWVFSSFVYLIPAVVITLQMLSPEGSCRPSAYDSSHESPTTA